MDFVTGLGPAFVAHRLRRLSDRVVDEIETLSLEGLSVPPRSASTILLLAERGPFRPHQDDPRTLRFSHPLMVRALRVLEELGLVRPVDHSADQRRRLVELTEHGQYPAAVLTRFNERLNRVMCEVLDEGAGNAGAFLKALEDIGGLLDRQPISSRLNMESNHKTRLTVTVALLASFACSTPLIAAPGPQVVVANEDDATGPALSQQRT